MFLSLYSWNIAELTLSNNHSLTLIDIVISVLIRFTACDYIHWYQLITLPGHLSSPSVFSGVRVTRSLVLCIVFCKSLFVLFSSFFWPLCFQSFFNLQLLITILISSNFSYLMTRVYNTGMCLFIKMHFPKKILVSILSWL